MASPWRWKICTRIDIHGGLRDLKKKKRVIQLHGLGDCIHRMSYMFYLPNTRRLSSLEIKISFVEEPEAATPPSLASQAPWPPAPPSLGLHHARAEPTPEPSLPKSRRPSSRRGEKGGRISRQEGGKEESHRRPDPQ